MPDAALSQLDLTAADNLSTTSRRAVQPGATQPLAASSDYPAVRQELRGCTPYFSP